MLTAFFLTFRISLTSSRPDLQNLPDLIPTDHHALPWLVSHPQPRAPYTNTRSEFLRAPDDQANLLQAELAVAEGQGPLAVAAISERPHHESDANALVLLGRAAYQAEQDRTAELAYKQVLEIDASNVEALLGWRRFRCERAQWRVR